MDDPRLAPLGDPPAVPHHSRRRVLQRLAGGLLALPAVGALGARYAAARGDEDDDEDDDDHSGHGGGDNSGSGSDNSGRGGGDGDDEEAPVVAPAVPPGSFVIDIFDDDGFTPSSLTVDPGQPITFVNQDGDDHTATGAGFDTGIIPEGGGSAMVVIDAPGTYAFVCQIHPEMTGTIGVRGPDGVVPPPAAAAPPPTDATSVRIANFAFAPAAVTVAVGQTVAWTNDDAAPHTVTALDGAFDSGIFDPGGGFSWTFLAPGTFPYRCNLHPQMLGEVVVTGDGPVPPPAATTDQPPPANEPAAVVPAPGETAVTIADFSFAPATLRVAGGTTVLWTNTGRAPHTVTGQFADSGALDPGQVFRHTFDQAGAFDYVCSFHPQMVGRIEVGPAAAPSDAADDSGDGERPDPPDREMVGTWEVVLTPDADADLAPQRALVTFHRDGTLEAVYAAVGDAADEPAPPLGPGRGEWEADGDGGYALALVSLLLDEGLRLAGTLTVRETGELDAAGDAYRGTFTFRITSPEGDARSAGGGTTRGTRLRVDSEPGTLPASPEAAPAATAATVTIQDLAFDPPTVEVASGTTVTWVNRDAVPHTATDGDGAFDTDRLDQGQRASHTFDQPGSFAYRCIFHPEMEGTVVVA